MSLELPKISDPLPGHAWTQPTALPQAWRIDQFTKMRSFASDRPRRLAAVRLFGQDTAA